MGTIEKVIKKFSVQPIVLWANPVLDGFGGATFDDPVQIKGRWEEKLKVINNKQGEEIISVASVLTNSELQDGEILYLGTLISLQNNSDLDLTKPKDIEGTFCIVAHDKIPMPRSNTDFARIYHLKPNWETKI